MGLLNNIRERMIEADLPDDTREAEKLMEDAIGDSVELHSLAQSISSGSRMSMGWLSKPVIDYLEVDEQPHFMYNSPIVDVDGEEIKAELSYVICATFTNYRILILIGHEEKDQKISIPYNEVNSFRVTAGGILSNDGIITTSENRYSFEIPAKFSSEKLKLEEFVRKRIGKNPEINVESPQSIPKTIDGELKSEPIEHSELFEQVQDRKEEGWEIVEIDNKNNKVIMETTKGGTIGGHALTAFTTGLWTFGGGNMVYNKMSKNKNSERIVIRPKSNVPSDINEVEQLSDISSKLRELKKLNNEGILTDEEYQKKKEEILDRV